MQNVPSWRCHTTPWPPGAGSPGSWLRDALRSHLGCAAEGLSGRLQCGREARPKSLIMRRPIPPGSFLRAGCNPVYCTQAATLCGQAPLYVQYFAHAAPGWRLLPHCTPSAISQTSVVRGEARRAVLGFPLELSLESTGAPQGAPPPPPPPPTHPLTCPPLGASPPQPIPIAAPPRTHSLPPHAQPSTHPTPSPQYVWQMRGHL